MIKSIASEKPTYQYLYELTASDKFRFADDAGADVCDQNSYRNANCITRGWVSRLV